MISSKSKSKSKQLSLAIYYSTITTLLLHVVITKIAPTNCLNIVIAGGTGQLGRKISSLLSPSSKQQHSITILTRNSFLASAPSRVTSDFGWLGKLFLDTHPHVKLRDWDGGDLLDIVGCDWMGWQEDTIPKADVILNLVGGFTEQRVMATERLVRTSLDMNPYALQIVVSPLDEEIRLYSPGAREDKIRRLKLCEDMVDQNCIKSLCLRVEMNDMDHTCEKIIQAATAASTVIEE